MYNGSESNASATTTTATSTSTAVINGLLAPTAAPAQVIAETVKFDATTVSATTTQSLFAKKPTIAEDLDLDSDSENDNVKAKQRMQLLPSWVNPKPAQDNTLIAETQLLSIFRNKKLTACTCKPMFFYESLEKVNLLKNIVELAQNSPVKVVTLMSVGCGKLGFELEISRTLMRLGYSVNWLLVDPGFYIQTTIDPKDTIQGDVEPAFILQANKGFSKKSNKCRIIGRFCSIASLDYFLRTFGDNDNKDDFAVSLFEYHKSIHLHLKDPDRNIDGYINDMNVAETIKVLNWNGKKFHRNDNNINEIERKKLGLDDEAYIPLAALIVDLSYDEEDIVNIETSLTKLYSEMVPIFSLNNISRGRGLTIINHSIPAKNEAELFRSGVGF